MAEVIIKGVNGTSFQVPNGLFINNKFVTASQNSTIKIENPATNNHLANISAAQPADIDAAVQAAQSAFTTTWKAIPSAQRGALLSKLADLVARDADILASLEAVDAGILFTESKNMHVPQAIETLRYFAGWADKIAGKTLDIPGGIAYTKREALGVCAAIVPWNAPLMITIWKLAPAIATGNTLIIKTPELCPLYGQHLAVLVREAGFPPGVINILCGEGRTAGHHLASHTGVKKIAFTGSTAVGRQILAASASSNLKKVTLELGGKGPSIVFPDADLENALFWTSLGITANNGQICAAGSRIYVHSSVYKRFLVEFSKRSREAVVGDPLLPETTKGPIISKAQHEKIMRYIEEGSKLRTARLLHGGEGVEGRFIANTAFADVQDGDSIMREEIFGPVAAIASFDTEDEVIAKANHTEYGLSAAIFTNDVSRAHRVSSALESGQVTVNCWGVLHANTPFGGVKQSGFGRDMGEDALDGWTAVKTVKFNLLPDSDKLAAKL